MTQTNSVRANSANTSSTQNIGSSSADSVSSSSSKRSSRCHNRDRCTDIGNNWSQSSNQSDQISTVISAGLEQLNQTITQFVELISQMFASLVELLKPATNQTSANNTTAATESDQTGVNGQGSTTQDTTTNTTETTKKDDTTEVGDKGDVKDSGETAPTPENNNDKAVKLSDDVRFLWKPKSAIDNKLVILTPKELDGKIKKVEIYSPDGKKQLGKGRETGVERGSQQHYRFDKEGNAYKDNCIVRITLKDGSRINIKIAETSNKLSQDFHKLT